MDPCLAGCQQTPLRKGEGKKKKTAKGLFLKCATRCRGKVRHYCAAEAAGKITPPLETHKGRCCSGFWHTLAFCSASARKQAQENVFSISPGCCISAQMKALVSSSWHHGDAAPRDRAEGGDKEPIERLDAESEPLLHQHFLTRSTVIIILWRDHKPAWVI